MRGGFGKREGTERENVRYATSVIVKAEGKVAINRQKKRRPARMRKGKRRAEQSVQGFRGGARVGLTVGPDSGGKGEGHVAAERCQPCWTRHSRSGDLGHWRCAGWSGAVTSERQDGGRKGAKCSYNQTVSD